MTTDLDELCMMKGQVTDLAEEHNVLGGVDQERSVTMGATHSFWSNMGQLEWNIASTAMFAREWLADAESEPLTHAAMDFADHARTDVVFP